LLEEAEEETPQAAESEAAQAAPPAEEPPPKPSVNLRNPLAVRVGFLAAAVIQLALMAAALAKVVQLLPLVLGAGGAYAVYLFARRSGYGISVLEGARLGWIVGVFTFVISTVLFTAGLLASGNGIVAMMEESLKTTGIDAASAEKALELLREPQYLGFFVLLMLGFNFLLVTVVCSLGGALGARLSRRE